MHSEPTAPFENGHRLHPFDLFYGRLPRDSGKVVLDVSFDELMAGSGIELPRDPRDRPVPLRGRLMRSDAL
jgi:hypothetical protein